MSTVSEPDDPGPDVVAPDSVIALPVQGSVVPGDGFVVSGSSFDEGSGVVEVLVRVARNVASPGDPAVFEFWDGGAFVGGSVWLPAVVDAGGAWSWSAVGLPAGPVTVHAYAVDAVGNVEGWGDGRPFVQFTVE